MQQTRTRIRTGGGKCILTVAALLTLFASSVVANAQAAEFKVVGTGGTLHVRTAPNLSASTVTSLRDGAGIDIVCQTTGDKVGGSTIWDKIDRPAAGYVADWYTSTPAVGKYSPGLAICGESAPGPVRHCVVAGIGYGSAPVNLYVSGDLCYNGTTVVSTSKVTDSINPAWWAAPFVQTLSNTHGSFYDPARYGGSLTLWANITLDINDPLPYDVDDPFSTVDVPVTFYLRVWVNKKGEHFTYAGL